MIEIDESIESTVSTSELFMISRICGQEVADKLCYEVQHGPVRLVLGSLSGAHQARLEFNDNGVGVAGAPTGQWHSEDHPAADTETIPHRGSIGAYRAQA